MRDFKGMKRQRGRNRNGGSAGGKPQQHNANRSFDSNGPEGIKVRGNAQHVFEKYQQLARDAQTGGDRVLAENYLQHAEHYFRVIRAVTPNRSPADILGRDAVQGGYDIDFEDESGAQAYADAQEAEVQANGGVSNGSNDSQQDNGQQQPRRDDRPFNRDQNQNQNQNRYENRQRDDRPRDDRGPREERQPREERPRDDRPRDERPRDERPREERAPREDRPRFRDRDRAREDRVPNPAADPLAVVEPQATPLPKSEPAAPALRSGDGDVSPAPNFLAGGGPRKVASLTPDAGEEAPKPKRRRAPKSFEGGETAAPATADEG